MKMQQKSVVKGNDNTPKLFEIFYLKIEMSKLKPKFAFCENFKFVSFKILGKINLSRSVMTGLGRLEPGWVRQGRFITYTKYAVKNDFLIPCNRPKNNNKP